jgi:hypothetical protein
MWRCWLLLRHGNPDDPPWFADSCRMTIAALCGFGVAAQFVSLEALEVPYYVALLGAGGLLVYSRMEREGTLPGPAMAVAATADWREQIDNNSFGPQRTPQDDLLEEPLLILN